MQPEPQDLRAITEHLNRQDAALAEHRKEARDRADKLERALHGTDDKPGIIIKLDRVEQQLIGYSRTVWIVIGTVVTLIIAVVAKGILK